MVSGNDLHVGVIDNSNISCTKEYLDNASDLENSKGLKIMNVNIVLLLGILTNLLFIDMTDPVMEGEFVYTLIQA